MHGILGIAYIHADDTNNEWIVVLGSLESGELSIDVASQRLIAYLVEFISSHGLHNYILYLPNSNRCYSFM